MTANDKELDAWTDTDVYYWVYEIDIGKEHAVAMWNGAVNGKEIIGMRKKRLQEICENLDSAITSNLWREIKKLQKQGRKSIFHKRGKPTPIMPDYPGDDSFDSDSDFDCDEEDDLDDSTDMNNHSSLPDLLKERLKEFKAQQEENEQDMYIAPDTDNQGPQDEYEEFNVDDDDDNQQLYITPQNDEGPPPPVPSRAPVSMDSKLMGAPVLPPRPGPSPSRALPRPNPAPPDSEDEEEEYIVPDTHAPAFPILSNNDDDDDCGDTYIEPTHNVQPIAAMKPPVHSRQPLPFLPKPPVPGGGKPPKSFSKPPEIIKKQPPLPIGNNARPMSQPSIASRMKAFESKPQATNSPAPQGGGLWQIIPNTIQPRPASSTLGLPSRKLNPPSPKRVNSPRPAPPLPSPTSRPAPSLPNPLSPGGLPASHSPTVPRKVAVPPSVRPIQPTPRTHTPDLPRLPFPNPSRPRTDENDMSDCDWFYINLSRDEAASALNRYQKQGTFVVRKSTKNPDFPYTLQLFYKGKIKNLQIGVRQDHKYALGALKEGETRFSSVRELIEYHRVHDVVLANNEGRTCLIKPVSIP